MSLSAVALLILFPLAHFPVSAQEQGELSPVGWSLDRAERAMEAGDLESARLLVRDALERDRKSIAAWAMRARLAVVL